jgi:hypothetical protein
MATQAVNPTSSGGMWSRLRSDLSDPARSISGPFFDAMLFWGCPLLALGIVATWLGLASFLPIDQQSRAIGVPTSLQSCPGPMATEKSLRRTGYA